MHTGYWACMFISMHACILSIHPSIHPSMFMQLASLLHLRLLLCLTALNNIELGSFLRWYVAVELYDPAYAKRFYSTYEILEENMVKVCIMKFL